MKRLKMIPNKESGLLITFCGLDGCGKTTQISLLSDFLEKMDIPILLTKQPTDFVRKSTIFRTYMDSPEHDEYDYRSLSLLAASDRVQHSNKVILPALTRGKTVISDRYYYSCLANLCARGYTGDEWIYEIAESIPQPDMAFFLDIDVEEATRRVRSRENEKDRFIDVNLQYKLREQYLDIAESNGGIVISTKQTINECFNAIENQILKLLKRV